ncbi:MAG: hypothetical protein E2O67_02190 [Deltaproteobacteria bacterium]|nr:MAG: hypothetical protein E2O67_02190 [Deltaproteobacteria bacterium]
MLKNRPSDARHHFLYRLLPIRIFRALEKGTRQWLQECRHCGYKQDYWKARVMSVTRHMENQLSSSGVKIV